MENNLEADLPYVESTLPSYIKPDVPFGGNGQPILREYVGTFPNEAIKNSIPEEMKPENVFIASTPMKIYDARVL